MKDERQKGEFSSEERTRENISEAYDEMLEYNATKKTVTDLLLYKKRLMNMGSDDFDKINEIKSKALEAINHLFNDIIAVKKN